MTGTAHITANRFLEVHLSCFEEISSFADTLFQYVISPLALPPPFPVLCDPFYLRTCLRSIVYLTLHASLYTL